MTATPAPHQPPIDHDHAHLRHQAEALISALSAEDALLGDPATLDLVVDGYAQVLALDVDRVRLEREIAQLAESGDPAVAPQLRELSVTLRWMTRTCNQLRELLRTVRARAEPSS